MGSGEQDKSLRSGERFVAPTVETIYKIDPMHVERYRAAAKGISEGAMVADAGCGCGYGSFILHEAGHKVTGIDDSGEAIDYAREHYAGPTFLADDAIEVLRAGDFDAIVCFDMLEHIHEPEVFIEACSKALPDSGVLMVSVPTVRVPEIIGNNPHHEKHYTASELIQTVGPGFEVYYFEHQPRHLGTGTWHQDCGLFGVFRKR